MTTGPVDVAEVRDRLGGAPSATDEELTSALDVAVAHVTPLLDAAAVDPSDPSGLTLIDYRDPSTWPDDLHDGIVIAAVLTWRNMESPTPAAAVEGGAPVVPPIAWDRWTRHRLGQYVSAGSWAQ